MSQDYTAAYIIKKVNITHNDDIKMLKDTSLDTIYKCSPVIKSAGLTLLMKLILLEKRYTYVDSFIMEKYGIKLMEKYGIKSLAGRAPLLRGIIKKYIASHPEEINKVNKEGWTPLMLMIPNVKRCSIQIIKLLLKYGANVNAMNGINWTVLTLVINYNPENCAQVVKKLLNHGADASIEGWTSLIRAIENNNIPVIKLLLDNNPRVDIVNKYEETMLMVACKRFKHNVVELLLKHTTNVNISNKCGNTALLIAFQNIIVDDYNILKPLFEYDSNINIKNKWNRSALDFCNNENKEIVSKMIDKVMLLNKKN